MANSDSEVLANLKTARDAIIAQIASGSPVVQYSVQGVMVRRADHTMALNEIEALISQYEDRVARATNDRGLGFYVSLRNEPQ